MPELPEIYNIAQQMRDMLHGKSITAVEVWREQCLNVPIDYFIRMVTGKPIVSIYPKGKWINILMEGDTFLLISLGMGGDIIYHEAGEELNCKYQFRFFFDNGAFMHIYFSWFGYVHAADGQSIKEHKMTSRLGFSPLDRSFSYEVFKSLLYGRKGAIKSFLLNQENIAGIGNVYVQDILFKSGIHPDRRVCDISEDEKRKLYDSVREHLRYAIKKGGLKYERDFFGRNGRYEYELVGHRPGELCPDCGEIIKKIRSGGTPSYICEKCQK